jgi:aspartyl-tRNA(Asn)/glutamyl-tRNA(Gln) amidotransferase subunit B
MSVMMGIEVHCQLNTESKLFCSDSSDSRGKKPNESTCPICMGFPGTKPKVNKKAIDHVITIGLALGCGISPSSFFSRKTYFYPDMSKNYQITQYEIPLVLTGAVTLGEDMIRIRRVHLEEDPARLVHVGGDITNAEYVLMDYNRSGVPLAEIVTEPDFTTPRQVRMFLEKLVSILEHIGVYDSSKEATLRVDANISIDGGERVEVKNVTGFENVEKALNFEITRQRGMARMEVQVERETRHFDAESETTKSLRKKEGEEDYGYIFDPDLPVIDVDEKWLASLKSRMPELPDHRVKRFAEQYGLQDASARVLVYTDKRLADFFEQCCRSYGKPVEAANWTINYLLKSLNWRSERIAQSKARPETFVELLEMIDKGEITERYAKELIKEYVDTGKRPREIAGSGGKQPVTDEELRSRIKEVMAKNEKAVKEFKAGKQESIQFLIGAVLKATGKKADPNRIRELLADELR